MIAKCSPIPHGSTAMDYNNRKEKAELVGFHGLPKDSTVDNFWSRMMDFQAMKRMEVQAWKPLKNTALRFEVSPENKYTEDWTLDDWHKLALDFLKEVDSITHRPPKKGKRQCELKPTNLQNSQFVISLHHDSKSGIRHMHILVNRVDMDGQTNDAHYIGERAMEAANRITSKRGWDLATDRRTENIEQLYDAAIAVLKEMPQFNWADFTSRMETLGYGVKLKSDNDGIIRGMCLMKGHSVYKSSELGHGRNLMPSKIESTWQKLHKSSQQAIGSTTQKVTEPKPVKPIERPMVQPQADIDSRPTLADAKVSYPVVYEGNTYTSEIEKSALDKLLSVVQSEIVSAGEETTMEVMNAAKVTMLLFGGYVGAATSISESFGGGGSPGSNWGKDRDDDDLRWLRRCARQAVWMCKSMRRSRTL